jgi:hypothetical protein
VGKLGRQIEKALDTASPAIAGLALMVERGHGSKTMISLEADKLAKAAKILREAIGLE